MIIITSASYIDQEFSSELGLIPPAFLPVGNKRLFNYQFDSLGKLGESIYLTIPASFIIEPHDMELINEAGVNLLRIEEGLSLGNSVLAALEQAGTGKDEPLRILHGDTLIRGLPDSPDDLITLSAVDGAYNWAVFNESGEDLLTQLDDDPLGGRRLIANGYFSFSSAAMFADMVQKTNGSFIAAINHYAQERSIAGKETEDWLDFGHIHTYYRSKARMTTQRAFNSLEIGRRTVTKSSADSTKMAAEYQWYNSVPEQLRIFLPQLIGTADRNGQSGYEVEYLYLTSLNELYVFGRLPRFVWRKIFDGCLSFLQACNQHPAAENVSPVSELFLGKTLQRLEQQTELSGLALNQSRKLNGKSLPDLRTIAEESAGLIPADGPHCVIHGDFCFSNVLFDFRTEAVRVIDPRGLTTDGSLSVFGNQHYDIAKLAHSVLGLYDFIIAGYLQATGDAADLELTIPDSRVLTDIQSLFLLVIEEQFGLNKNTLNAMQIQLFLSMLPLHADHPARQRTMLANALRLYAELDGA